MKHTQSPDPYDRTLQLTQHYATQHYHDTHHLFRLTPCNQDHQPTCTHYSAFVAFLLYASGGGCNGKLPYVLRTPVWRYHEPTGSRRATSANHTYNSLPSSVHLRESPQHLDKAAQATMPLVAPSAEHPTHGDVYNDAHRMYLYITTFVEVLQILLVVPCCALCSVTSSTPTFRVQCRKNLGHTGTFRHIYHRSYATQDGPLTRHFCPGAEGNPNRTFRYTW